MKFFSLVLLLAVVMPAHAAYVSTSCSNATGSVIWEEGENTNLVRLTYDGFVTGVLELSREQIVIERKEEVNLREQLLSQCGAQSSMTVSAARVVITPALSNPDIFQSYFPNQKIVTDVICEKIVSNQSDCHP